MSNNENWFSKLFINEAKKAIEYHNKGGGGELSLQEKEATANGEVVPDEGYDGLSKVIVDVPDYPLYEGTFEQLLAPTKGLTYALTGDLKSYSVTGAGTSTVTDIIIPDSYNGLPVTEIAGSAFRNSEITSVYIPDSVTRINDYAFYKASNLKTIRIPETITYMGASFYSQSDRPSLQTTVENNIIYLGNENNPYLVAVGIVRGSTFNADDFSQRCIMIGYNMVTNNHNLITIEMPDNIKFLMPCAFNNCRDLKTIKFSKNITYIYSSFDWSRNLTLFDFSTHTSVPTLDNIDVFENVNTNCKIIVPDALYDEWVAANYWNKYTSRIIKASEYAEE